MDTLDKLGVGNVPPPAKNTRPILVSDYNVMADKINEVIGNTLSTEYDESTTPMNYIRVCTQAVYNTLNSTNYPQYDNTLFFIIE